MPVAPQPLRGDIWLADLGPTQGNELAYAEGQYKPRPVIILSSDALNRAPGELSIIVPLGSTNRHLPYHLPITRTINGKSVESYICCEQIRCISHSRLKRKVGEVTDAYLTVIGEYIQALLNILPSPY